MIGQIDNRVISSFLLYLDNKIMKKGLAYETGAKSYYYPIYNPFSNYYIYSSPFSPINADSSITGAPVMSGVYLSGVFITTGQSGLANIDYDRNLLYFTNEIPNASTKISGNFSVKDFRVKLTSDAEETILFETKQNLRPKIYQNVTGAQTSESSFPAIYIRSNGRSNRGIAFGGEDITSIDMRATILADSQFNLDAVGAIMSDLERTYIPLLSGSEFPFNSLNGLKTGYYNYDTLTSGKVIANQNTFISEISVNKFFQNLKSDANALAPDIYVAFADITLEVNRFPRI